MEAMVIHNLYNTGSRDRFHVVAMQAPKHFKEEEKKRIKRELLSVNQRIRAQVQRFVF